jgi:hypothetical protein
MTEKSCIYLLNYFIEIVNPDKGSLEKNMWISYKTHYLRKTSRYINSAIAVLLLSLSTSACGNSDSDNQAPESKGVDSQKSRTLAELESSGELPVLDRSTSLEGPDSDNNGIRDDIDTYLRSRNYEAPQLAASQQAARAYQTTVMIDLNDANQRREAARKITEAIECLADRFPFDSETSFGKISRDLEKLTMNTKERVRAYMKFNKSLDGIVSTDPLGDTCEN